MNRTERAGVRSVVLLAGVIATLLLASACTSTVCKAPVWGYSGPNGPENWSRMQGFEACAGRNQSPLLLDDTVPSGLQPFELDYQGETAGIVYEKHDIEVEVEGENWLTVDGKRFRLKQFHFHTPSENRLPMAVETPIEAHFVHMAEDGSGEIAVVAVLFRSGDASPGIAAIQNAMPTKRCEHGDLHVPIAELGLVPEDHAYWRFSGSLTTPPCTEGLRWLVLRTQATASAEQAAAFERVTGKNARPVQKLWARRIFDGADR